MITFNNPEDVSARFSEQGYISDPRISLSVFLSMKLQKPLLIEGPAGVGKTAVAKILSQALDTELIRLQCYEGLDAHHAIYEWNYQRQLLQLKIEENGQKSLDEKEQTIFSEKFLLKRPLLQAITADRPPVLLIDEVDRADEEFESFLLEVLSDWQITIPETGTISAKHIPYVIVTSNRVRDLSEALRRRCLYLWIEYPSFEKELAIIQEKVPGINEKLASQICAFMQTLRKEQLEKAPGVAESIDWAFALTELHFDHLDPKVIEETLGVVLKDWEDTRQVQMSLTELWERTGVKLKI